MLIVSELLELGSDSWWAAVRGWLGCGLSRSPCGQSLVLPISWGLHRAPTWGPSSTEVSGRRLHTLCTATARTGIPGERPRLRSSRRRSMVLSVCVLLVTSRSPKPVQVQGRRHRPSYLSGGEYQGISRTVLIKSTILKKKNNSHFQRCPVSPLP